jgi:hypothetical protein
MWHISGSELLIDFAAGCSMLRIFPRKRPQRTAIVVIPLGRVPGLRDELGNEGRRQIGQTEDIT